MKQTIKALITGITGQDGSYLAEFLLKKGYQVHGLKRRSSLFNTQRIDHLIKDRNVFQNKNFYLHHADMTDSSSINYLISKIQPNEVYNLAAQSHVAVSFEQPEYTANSVALGPLRLLEAIKNLNLIKKTKFYQASTSELFGNSYKNFQNENTKFSPTSPYATAKLYAHWTIINYREAYNMFAVNGILFVDNDGMMNGQDINYINKISKNISVPLISLGGIGSEDNIEKSFNFGANAVAAGSFFVFNGPHKAVLISYKNFLIEE
ncbi:MAG: hypothetical protein CMN79_02145 [Spirochaetales bacterium]|nr:hypothetical protein [Spirochaetales bacterium]|tara:strand:+ start:5002 stop:5793 length:792 start_codon:yes stop_codon:yes gene_type:complete